MFIDLHDVLKNTNGNILMCCAFFKFHLILGHQLLQNNSELLISVHLSMMSCNCLGFDKAVCKILVNCHFRYFTPQHNKYETFLFFEIILRIHFVPTFSSCFFFFWSLINVSFVQSGSERPPINVTCPTKIQYFFMLKCV